MGAKSALGQGRGGEGPEAGLSVDCGSQQGGRVAGAEQAAGRQWEGLGKSREASSEGHAGHRAGGGGGGRLSFWLRMKWEVLKVF